MKSAGKVVQWEDPTSGANALLLLARVRRSELRNARAVRHAKLYHEKLRELYYGRGGPKNREGLGAK